MRFPEFLSGHAFLIVLVTLIGQASSLPGEPTSPGVEQPASEFPEYAKQAASQYDLRAESADGRRLVLREEPILRWSNPLGGRQAHGDVFLWTDDGRPAAVLSLYEYTTPDGILHEHHEFCSLASSPIVGQGPRNRGWSPGQAGVKLSPISDSSEAAATAARRLNQMRELAGRFSAEKTTREEQETRELRLLSQPVVRYSSGRHEVYDGAMFAFVEATDPEIFLLIEAWEVNGAKRWHYGLARMNSLRLAARYLDEEAWEVQTLPWAEVMNRREKTYAIFPTK